MKYLLDTCVISDFVKGNLQVQSRLKSEQPKNLAISSVTWMEIQYGLALNPPRAKNILPIISVLVEAIHLIPYQAGDASATATLRAYLKNKGTPIGPYDVMIAGCAQNHQLTLVTSNTDEFNRVSDLVLEDWRLHPIT